MTGCTAGIYLSIRDLRDLATCLAGGPHEKLSLNKARVWRPRRKGMRHDERCVYVMVLAGWHLWSALLGAGVCKSWCC